MLVRWNTHAPACGAVRHRQQPQLADDREIDLKTQQRDRLIQVAVNNGEQLGRVLQRRVIHQNVVADQVIVIPAQESAVNRRPGSRHSDRQQHHTNRGSRHRMFRAFVHPTRFYAHRRPVSDPHALACPRHVAMIARGRRKPQNEQLEQRTVNIPKRTIRHRDPITLPHAHARAGRVRDRRAATHPGPCSTGPHQCRRPPRSLWRHTLRNLRLPNRTPIGMAPCVRSKRRPSLLPAPRIGRAWI